MTTTNTYYYCLANEITWPFTHEIIQNLYEKFINNEFNHLVLLISSEGGDIEAAWVIFSTLRSLGCKITTIANGRVYSAGVLLLLAGDRILSFKNTMFLFHPPTIAVTKDVDMDLPELSEHVASLSLEKKKLMDLLATKIKNTEFLTKINTTHDSYFIDESEAKELGLVDKVINTINEIEDEDE